MKFKMFPSFDTVKTNTEAGVQTIIQGNGENRLLIFNKPVRAIELNKLEALKIAFALLGRIGICENCGFPFRRKASVGLYAKARFCCRECFYEWTRKTGWILGKYMLVETDNGYQLTLRERFSKDSKKRKINIEAARRGGKTTQRLHPHVRENLLNSPRRGSNKVKVVESRAIHT